MAVVNKLEESELISGIQSGASKAMRFADDPILKHGSSEVIREQLNQLATEAVRDGHILYILRNRVEPSDKMDRYDFGKDLYFEVAGHGVGFWDGDWDEVLTQDQIEYLGEWTDGRSIMA